MSECIMLLLLVTYGKYILIHYFHRPRPDFLARCFPDGLIGDPEHCKGDAQTIIDGYKSFPSGHSTCK